MRRQQSFVTEGQVMRVPAGDGSLLNVAAVAVGRRRAIIEVWATGSGERGEREAVVDSATVAAGDEVVHGPWKLLITSLDGDVLFFSAIPQCGFGATAFLERDHESDRPGPDRCIGW